MVHFAMKHMLACWSMLLALAAALHAEPDNHAHHAKKLAGMDNTEHMKEYIHNLMAKHRTPEDLRNAAIRMKQAVNEMLIDPLFVEHAADQAAMFQVDDTFFGNCTYAVFVGQSPLEEMREQLLQCRIAEAELYKSMNYHCNENKSKELCKYWCAKEKENEIIPDEIPEVCEKKVDLHYIVTNEEESKRVRDYFNKQFEIVGGPITNCSYWCEEEEEHKTNCTNDTDKYGNKTEECCHMQEQMELLACDNEGTSQDQCTAFQECYGLHVQAFAAFNNSMRANELSRQVRYRGAKEIVCILDCYEDETASANRGGCINDCKAHNYLECETRYPTTTTTTTCYTRSTFPYHENYIDNFTHIFNDYHNYKVIAFTRYSYAAGGGEERICVSPPVGCGGGCPDGQGGAHAGVLDLTYMYCGGGVEPPVPDAPACPEPDPPICSPCDSCWYDWACARNPVEAPCCDPVSKCCKKCNWFVEYLTKANGMGCPSGVHKPNLSTIVGFSEGECCDGVHWHTGRWPMVVCNGTCGQGETHVTRDVWCTDDMETTGRLADSLCADMPKPTETKKACDPTPDCCECLEDCPVGYFRNDCGGISCGTCDKCTYDHNLPECDMGCYFGNTAVQEASEHSTATAVCTPLSCRELGCDSDDIPQYREGCGGTSEGHCVNCTLDCKVGFYKKDCGGMNPGTCNECACAAGNMPTSSGQAFDDVNSCNCQLIAIPVNPGDFVIDLFKEEVHEFEQRLGAQCQGTAYTDSTSYGCNGFLVDSYEQCLSKCKSNVQVPDCNVVAPECQAFSYNSQDRMCHLWHSCPGFVEGVGGHIVSGFKKHIKWDGHWTDNGVPEWVTDATVKKPGNEAGFETLSWVRLTPQCNLPSVTPGFIKILLYLEQGENYLLKLDTAWWPMSGKAVKGSMDVGNIQLESVVQVLVEQATDGAEVPPAKAAAVHKAFDRVNHLEWETTYFQITPDENFINLTIFESQFNCLAIKSALLYKMEVTWEGVLNELCVTSQYGQFGMKYARHMTCNAALNGCRHTPEQVLPEWQCFSALDETAALGEYCLSGTGMTTNNQLPWATCQPGTGSAISMTSAMLIQACERMGFPAGQNCLDTR